MSTDFQVEIGLAYFDEMAKDGHLHFVASSPDEVQVLVLNFTSSETRQTDKSSVFLKGEHPWLKEPESWIAWHYAELVPTARLASWVASGDITPHQRLISRDILERVWTAAGATAQLGGKFKKMLAAQQLIASVVVF